MMRTEHARAVSWSGQYRHGAGTGRATSRYRVGLTLLMAVLAAGLCASATAQAPARVALVLAAENYTHFKASPIGVARAEAMAAALRGHGFAVTLAADPDSTATRGAIQAFARDARDAHLALVILSGHGAASLGRTFFLPVDAQLSRATDLLSRGVTIDSVAQSAAGAQRGAVMFLMSAANFAATLGRVDAQASMTTPPAEHVTVVFSSSDRVPLASMDSVSARAADSVVQALEVAQPGLSALLEAAAGTGGLLLGSRVEADLWRSPEPVQVAEQPPAPAAPTEPDAAVEIPVDATGETAVAAPERTDEALASAETSPPDATDGAAASPEQTGAAPAEVIASAEAADTAGAATQAPAQEAGATAPTQAAGPTEAPPVAAQAAATPPPAPTTGSDSSADVAQGTPATAPPPDTAAAPATETMDLAALQAAEARLSTEERRQIQRALRSRGLYRGYIDAIFGPLTRAAIRQLQRDAQAAETGYLTPQQARQLRQP